MTDEELKKFFDEGLQYYKHSLFNKAIEIWEKIPIEDSSDYQNQILIGLAYKEVNNLEKAIEYWEKIPIENESYHEVQLLIGLAYKNLNDFENAIEYWKKIPIEYKSYHQTQILIGLVYKDLNDFENTIEYWKRIPIEHRLYHQTQYNIGVTYILLENSTKTSKAFINSQKEVFDLLHLLNRKEIKEDTAKRCIVKEVLSNVLDSKTDDFFNTTIKKDNKNKDIYKEIFLKSLYIINLLHVSADQEKQVAHYTRKWAAEQMLFAKSPLRLSTVIGANDPKEGVTLLDFLGINNNETRIQTPYQAFITCFTFNHESLNQFRLYGKENNKEATGISIIVKKDFFSDSISLNISYSENEQPKGSSLLPNEGVAEKLVKETKLKYSLYRCIYIDPKTKKVISIGHKEKDCFYREMKNNKPVTFTESKELISGMSKYKDEINTTLRKVKIQIQQLNSYIKTHKKDLDESIISELLLPLRHLTKHAAFKEEQECRIFDIENLKTSDIISPKRDSETCTFNTMHIDYEADLSDYVEKVIFAPMTPDLEQFHAFSKYKGYNFPCERCDHPFSMKTT